jgi:hypothetical protein
MVLLGTKNVLYLLAGYLRKEEKLPQKRVFGTLVRFEEDAIKKDRLLGLSFGGGMFR